MTKSCGFPHLSYPGVPWQTEGWFSLEIPIFLHATLFKDNTLCCCIEIVRFASLQNLTNQSYQINFVPKCHEGESEEKAECSPKIGHQGRNWEDQLFCFDEGTLWDGPEGKGKIFRLETWLFSLSNKNILFVVARLYTVCQLFDLFGFCLAQ